MARKHVSGRQYLLTWAGLVALTFLSFGLSFARTGLSDVAMSLAIAFAKAMLVALFFMHLVEQRTANRLVPVLSGLLALVLIVLVAADVATRHTFPKAPAPPVIPQPAG